MKKLLYRFIVAASLPIIAQTASAQVLFSDNFNGITGPSGYPATPTTGANFELGIAGRQGGTLATPTLGYVNGFRTDGNEQLGNPNTLSADNLDNNVVGDNLLLANLGTDMINYDFSSINGPLTITFNGNSTGGDGTDWFSFMIATSPTSKPFITDGGVAGILFRQNGGTEIWDNGSNLGDGTAVCTGRQCVAELRDRSFGHGGHRFGLRW